MVLPRGPVPVSGLFHSHLYLLWKHALSKSLYAPVGHDKILGVEVLVSDLNFFYTDSGKTSAPTVVFIHGFPFDHTMWEEQAALAAPSFRVITYDQRGHGRTGVGDGQYIFESFADDLFRLLDTLHVNKAILCGLSMGGYVALRAAERSPERILGLILCDTRSEADGNEAKLKRAASIKTVREAGVQAFAEGFLKAIFAPSSFTEKPEAVEKIRRVMTANLPQGICGTLIALATRTDTTPVLAAVQVPTLILVGEHDSITPPAAAKAMHERIPHSQMAVIPRAAHMSNLENPTAFNKELTSFLKRFS
jgi:3-oxoadipate enol-lactonase